MMKSILIFALASSLFASERFELDRSDGSKLIGYYDAPESNSFSIALILPGSQKETSLRLHEALKGELLQINKCPVTLEKYGIDQDKVDEKTYIQALSLQERLQDHHLLLKALEKGLIPGWDKTISVIGQGDGGRIAAAFASRHNCVAAVALIGAGGAWPVLEETLYSFRQELVDQGYSPQYIHGFLVQARQELAQATKTAKPEHKAFGYTHKYWDSLLKIDFLDNLASLTCPIYTINGDQDSRVPIESVNALAKKLEGKITVNRKEKAGRELLQDLTVYQEAILWLGNQ